MRCYGYDCGAVLTRRCERLGDPWHDTPSAAYYRGSLANRRSLCPLRRKLFFAGQPRITV
ncbi:hypothetical protein CORC01_08949 [Colletotrichum orchidophilum]|uniref:Uncharacterized protein n=1 Tax=Colletotrichum orchidophilum TaxID=1209926 RepID=A0A1G4B306_9PEZI|nr:uncharacterized protein CORC01_08949 [Colletotrichum orchidophilum]OHE95808.1 hypothetical protein CORC01_08949 [Colletotrichum orchidophilum]